MWTEDICQNNPCYSRDMVGGAVCGPGLVNTPYSQPATWLVTPLQSACPWPSYPPPPPPPPPLQSACFVGSVPERILRIHVQCSAQDFEALTPNLLARTVETVEGGGVIVILLRTLTSLRQLVTMTMDVHTRFRTESHQDVVGRFNER